MSTPESPVSDSPRNHVDPYLPVEEAAARLGVPLPMLIRRIEAGDVPARRIDGEGGTRWLVRLGDLGVEPSTANGRAPESSDPQHVELHGAGRAVSRVEDRPAEVRSEVAGLMLDPRELVSGLLDRWERTLEQRIYAEQRQRFEAELLARQTMLREAQLELKAVRAENAASKAEHSRVLADRDRALLDAQRELDQARRAAHQAQIQLQATEKRKRGWFFRR